MKGNKNMLHIEKEEEEEEKKDLVSTGFDPRTPSWESNVTTAAPANYVFKIESNFCIITYSN